MEYGLIGEKLGHSFSKIVHGFLANYDYELKEIPRDELADFMKKAEFKAINVTIPYKQEVIPYLYEISEIAKRIGAVNTIINRNGRLYGYNTDYSGMKALIKYSGIELKGKTVLILGSGGTSKTAFTVASDLGAKEVFRVSRKAGKGLITYPEAMKTGANVIINTTPCGMYPNIGDCPIDITAFPFLTGVVDAIYNPLSSALVVKAQKKGIKAVGGLYMLVAQAVFACEKFLEKEFSKQEIERIYLKIFKQKQNLVLIGMPSCGKTTVGERLSFELKKEFIDTDAVITQKAGISIPEIFEKYGEQGFREIESDVIRELSSKQSCVIATGGGAILNPQNVEFLKRNGVIVFLDRPLEKLITTDDRPLSSDRELLEKRYIERYGIYCSSADIRVNAEYDIETNTNAVKEGFLSENLSN